jgi:hypothetical protein
MALTPQATRNPDKIIISNKSGMTVKYTAAGVANIYAALARLIAADATRGLTTVIIDIDDPAQVTAFGAAPIINAADQSGAKRIVDAIDAKFSPDYFLLLDGPDVIPHIKLLPIPGLNDGDSDIPSDLPYACAAPFSNNANTYLAVTRVVGRLPMPNGSTDADALVQLIDLCSVQVPRPVTAYSPFFAMSADTWKISTQLTLSTLFGSNSGLSVSPTAGHAGIDPSLAALTHVINCHGATNDPRFYGQQANNFPVAMHSTKVAPCISKGTIAAAECCFGAELYNPTLTAAGGDPMSLVYLRGGAAAYVGSTNTAYGPFSSNGQADLMVQYFIDIVLKGASTGRAMLQARQRFVTTQKMADPVNLKTLAQFVLYGDPSVVPVNVSQPAAAAVSFSAPVDMADALTTAKDLFGARVTFDDARSGRESRRVSLKSEGVAAASAATSIGRPARTGGPAMAKIQAMAKERGYSGDVYLFNVDGGTAFRQATKSMDRKQRVAVSCEREEHQDPGSGAKHTLVRVLVAHILGDGIVAVDESASR